MTSREAKRLSLVRDLLALARPLEELAAELAGVEWDFEGDGVELGAQHLQYALGRFLEGAVTAAEVEKWANLIEGREDFYFQRDGQRQIEEVLYELANPLLTQRLDSYRASELLKVLG